MNRVNQALAGLDLFARNWSAQGRYTFAVYGRGDIYEGCITETVPGHFAPEPGKYHPKASLALLESAAEKVTSLKLRD